MNDSKPSTAVTIEQVSIGERQTRVSVSIVVLLCLIPALTAILFGGVDSITWVLLTIFWLTVIALWLVETWRARGLLINPSPLLLPLAGLLALGLIQLLPIGSDAGTGLLSVEAGRALTMDPYWTRLFLVHVLILCFYFAACLTFVNTEKRLRLMVVFLIVFGAVMAFIGILQRLADPETIYGLRTPFAANPFGPFVNQHHFAAFMEMAGGVALGILLGTIPRDKKVLAGIALGIMAIALILTGSRGGMLSFLALAGFAILIRALYRPKADSHTQSDERTPLARKLTVIASAAAIVIGVVGSILFIGGDASLTRGLGLISPTTDVSNGRLRFWSIALQIFRDHPILGAGLDAYGVAFPQYDTWNGFFRVEAAHNDYLQMLADGGLIGFGLVIVFIFLLFRKGLRTIKNTGPGLRRDIAIGALAGCFGILVHSFFDFPLRTWSNSFFFLMLAAIATVAVKPEIEQNSHKRRRRRTNAP